MKLWEKGYKLDKQIESFTVGEDYILDQKLVSYDCLASIAHVKMLGRIGILKRQEVKRLVRELNNIIKLTRKGRFKILKEQEDCHTAIENYLIKKLGRLGKKIHTARSRNDQVLTALRLYYKDELSSCKKLINDLIGTFKKFLKQYGGIKLPGYTHTRKAMPSSVALWVNSFVDSMKDNLKLIDFTLQLIDQSPLGTGAGYGIPFKIDREYTKKLLRFKKLQKNPIYTQNSRGKFESTILHALTQIMFDLNKIASDLIVFSMPEFGYFELPKNFCTGSSIMPQKKNPDALELLRAKYHVVVSYEFQVKNTIGNLLSGYNRDLQLTKEPTMKGFEITKESLSVMSLIFKNLKVDKEKCNKALTKDIYATEKAYKLVEKGVPFREAYKIISENY
ncbi:argininosuccinate lyase [bacterium (Candidatus Gribaldobacteria) CG_4_10_14_0_2_um_filter_36_18]|uniref:Argininosuccinate lyase n=1 Tax=bacterium (Candidatus Gribaldobacteria) CG_4_10_14_0_2_um_filter_36_18 TaxID=2014264 RepID=A0A2M7VL25_9BACT|nr:MAG: argininosuccinate lyase [bacterium (Candidatus Gribaldobacteria) CG_4_10_14_0_2_um_filter_36_18]